MCHKPKFPPSVMSICNQIPYYQNFRLQVQTICEDLFDPYWLEAFFLLFALPLLQMPQVKQRKHVLLLDLQSWWIKMVEMWWTENMKQELKSSKINDLFSL